MKILKILASNSKSFRAYGILKKLQIDDDKGGNAKYNNFLDNFCLKKPLVFFLFSWVSFLIQETQK